MLPYASYHRDLVYFRRLQEAEDQNRELLTTVARREEALHQTSVYTDMLLTFLLAS